MKSRQMMSEMGKIRILVLILLITAADAQDEFNNQDLLRLQQYAVNSGQGDPITNFNTNVLQRDPKGPVDVQYHLTDDSNNNGDYSKSDRGRSRKVYRIKNPFQQQPEDERTAQESNISYDSATGASNQYPAIQYSLPPEEFLQQMRENQYQQQQFSTQVSSYTATPQPPYQFSTLAPNFDNNQQMNQISSTEPKTYTPAYQSNANSFQYNPNTYNLNVQRSTPLSPYLSTTSSQYLGTPVNNYVSTSLPYVSSQQSLQQYVSSPLSNIQSGTFDYNNNRVTTFGNNVNNYETNDQNKRMQIDHYDNSANGIRYPLNMQSQNDFPSSTVSPSSTQYSDSLRESWQNAMNALSKSEQSYSPAQYLNYRYNSNQQDTRQDINTDISNTDNQRTGNMASANNLYLNYAQPDYQSLNTRERSRDLEQETSPSETYSHGDYGWKLSDRKASFGLEVSTNPNNYFKYQINSLQPETGVVSQVNFQMDSSKPYNYDQSVKPVSEKFENDEFAKAAAKVHENYKQQLEANKYSSNTNYNIYNNNNIPNIPSYYNYSDKPKGKLFSDYSNSLGNSHLESITANPFYYLNQKVAIDAKSKQPFDHDKALKNIVPIDVSNVVQNSDSQIKGNSELDLTNKYNIFGYNKDTTDSRQAPDSSYKDKNSIYTLNFKTKPDELLDTDKLRQIEQSNTYFGKPQVSDGFYKFGINSGNKRYIDEITQSLNLANLMSNNHNDNPQMSVHVQQQGMQQRPQVSSDMGSILKLNDLPYRLTQGLNSDTLRLYNGNYGNVPSALPIQINQNVEHHNVDVTHEILNKLMGNKRNSPTINMNRPDMDGQTGNLISNINGFKVANPFNVDLKLVADILKGKPATDNSQMTSLRGDYNKSPPMKLDVSQLQQFLQLKNENNAMALNNGVSSLSNSFFDMYNNERFPYQGVKYSRSEEEPENIPLADTSNNHPIGAVIEESLNEQDVPESPEAEEESLSTSIEEDISKVPFTSNPRFLGRRQKPAGSGYSNRYSYKKKYPKSESDEPYPLLKPPPPRLPRHRGLMRDKSGIRRRVNRPKMLRLLKTEPLFEAGSFIQEVSIKPSTIFKYSFAEDKSDVDSSEEDSEES